jgi:hypothetical protein
MKWAIRTRTTMIRAICTFATAVLCTVASGAPPDKLGKIDFELTGTVFDADTKEPLEGAYVVAAYKIQRAGLEAITSWCVKTEGMYTGQDGKYHFAVERLDGRNPFSTNAIKPGYFWQKSALPESELWKKQNAEAYSRRDIYLKKQDPVNPNLRFSDGDEFCDHASTREAAAGGAEFLKLTLAEVTKYGPDEQKRSALAYLIQSLEALPTDADLKK